MKGSKVIFTGKGGVPSRQHSEEPFRPVSTKVHYGQLFTVKSGREGIYYLEGNGWIIRAREEDFIVCVGDPEEFKKAFEIRSKLINESW